MRYNKENEILRLEGKVKESDVDLIIYNARTAAIHFKLENKVLIYEEIKMSSEAKQEIINKDWKPEVEYLNRENFKTAVGEFKPRLDWED